MIYADYNATTPCLPEAADLMRRMLCECYGNPSNRASLFCREARGALDLARQQVARAAGAQPDEISFCSGSTEACNQAIFGVLQQSLATRPRILTSAIEHPAVCMPAAAAAAAGADWQEIPVDRQGRVNLSALAELLREPTCLVCVMAANNETGVLQNLPAVAELTHAAGALLFSDMTQLLGKVPFDVKAERVDLACFSAHKCYGPKGVGALYQRRGLQLPPLLHGGGQENGRRSGTENVPAIAAFGLVADRAAREVQTRSARLARMTRNLEKQLLTAMPSLVVQSSATPRIPGTSMLTLPGLNGNWLAQLGDLVVSGGSACASLQEKPSHVLLAMGCPESEARRSVRVSLGLPTQDSELRTIAQRLIRGAETLGILAR